MVKELEDSDPFALFDEEDEEQDEVTPEAEPVNAEEVQQLREFKAMAEAQQREAEIASTFEQVGLSPKAARLFAALNPEGEVTTEAVRTFAKDYDLPVAERGYTPTVITQSGSMPAKTYTRDEIAEIYRENPARAEKLYEEGRVRWNNPDQIEGRPRR